MDAIRLLGSAMGLGLLSGISLYGTVLAVGLGIRFDLLHLNPGMAPLHVLADTRVLVAAGVAFLLEFLADKIPWVDTAWDSVHTFIRPLGAAALAATAFADMDPVYRTLLVVACGGAAFSGHSAKAATRLLVNHSPEPFTNVAISFAEDLAVPAGVWLAMNHPYWMLGVATVFLAAFAWLSPKIFRLVRLEVKALGAVFRKYFVPLERAEVRLPEVFSSAPLDAFGQVLSERAAAVPEKYRLGPGAAGVRCSAGRGVRGPRNSFGYLCCDTDRLVFVTRRWLRPRRTEIPLAGISACEVRRRLLLDRLRLIVESREQTFHLLKG